jgi:hypothetical protein
MAAPKYGFPAPRRYHDAQPRHDPDDIATAAAERQTNQSIRQHAECD